jgi:hypothetical protein
MAKNLGLPSDPALLSALLEGLQMSRQRLDAQIASVRAAIAGEPETEAAPAPAADAPAAPRKGRKGRKPGSKNKVKPGPKPAAEKSGPKPGRRKLSPAARKAIAAAQKRRWEEFRKRTEAK